MDTGTHLKAIWRRRYAVLAVTAVTGLLVLSARSAVTPTWTAQSDLFLVTGAGVSSADGDVRRLSAFYAEIVDDERVAANAVERSGLAVTAREFRTSVEVTVPEDGQLTVRARQLSARAAADLANAVGEALSDGAAADQREALRKQVAPLDAELQEIDAELAALPPDAERAVLLTRQERAVQARVDRLAQPPARLDLVRRALPEDAERRPQPVRDAVLGGLVAFLLAAEAAALLAARRRGLEGGDPRPELAEWTGLPVFRCGSGRYGPDETAAVLQHLQNNHAGRTLYVAPLRAGAVAEAASAHLADVARERGLDVASTRLSEDGAPGRTADQVRIVSADVWHDPLLVEAAGRDPGPCVLLVEARHVRRPSLEEAARVLAFAGLPPVALLVVEGRGVAASTSLVGSG